MDKPCSERGPSYPPNYNSYIEKLNGGVFARVINAFQIENVPGTRFIPLLQGVKQAVGKVVAVPLLLVLRAAVSSACC